MNAAAIIACVQLSLLRCPLLRVETVQDCLSASRDQVNKMIESGELPFAFDLANESKRADPRVFALCVAEKTGWKSPCGQTKNFNLPEVIGMILPKRDLRSTELMRILACSHQLVHDSKNKFTVARKAAASSGPNSYTVFTRASVATFLAKRRMV
jgi:hypothetical protein